MGSHISIHFTKEPKGLERTLKQMGFESKEEPSGVKSKTYCNERCSAGVCITDWGNQYIDEVREEVSKYLPLSTRINYNLWVHFPRYQTADDDYALEIFSRTIYRLKKRYKSPLLTHAEGGIVPEISWEEFYRIWRIRMMEAKIRGREWKYQLRLIQFAARLCRINIDSR